MSKSSIVDTNLSVLLVVGIASPSFIKPHKRLNFDQTDFEILRQALGERPKLILSPNVLTETSNIARYVAEPRRSEIALTLSRMILTWPETYIASRDATARSEYLRLGLTDAVLLELATREGGTLYTADLDLYLAALNAGLKAINFNHLRDARPDFQ